MDTEIIPIAIQLTRYNQNIANVVENLLAIDDKLFGRGNQKERP